MTDPFTVGTNDTDHAMSKPDLWLASAGSHGDDVHIGYCETPAAVVSVHHCRIRFRRHSEIFERWILLLSVCRNGRVYNRRQVRGHSFSERGIATLAHRFAREISHVCTKQSPNFRTCRSCGDAGKRR